MNTLIFISVCLIMVSLFAIFLRCAPVVSKPSDITLAQALTQVRDGIQLLQVRPPGSKPAGLLISEVQVTFNITAKASNSDKICLDLSPPPIAKVIPKGSIESKSDVSSERGNQITFKFQNLFLASKETLIGMSVAPFNGTSETVVTTSKDGVSVTEKAPVSKQLVSLKDLFELLDKNSVVTFAK